MIYQTKNDISNQESETTPLSETVSATSGHFGAVEQQKYHYKGDHQQVNC